MADIPCDPFTRVQQRLWQTLSQHREFARMVRLNNRLVKGRATSAVLPADLPQVEIRPGACRVRLFATTTSSVIEQDFTIGVITGQHQPQQSLHPLRWQIIRAISTADDTLGLSFVEKVRLGDQRLQSAEPGWSAVLSLTVVMRFDNQRDLQSQESPQWI